MKKTLTLGLCASLLQFTLSADIPHQLGVNGPSGNAMASAAARDARTKIARAGFDRSTHFWDGTNATPETLDETILDFYAKGFEPVINPIQYESYEPDLGNYDKWFKIGKAYAERYRPNSPWLKSQGIYNWGCTQYVHWNEINSNWYPTMTPAEYVIYVQGYADGIHSVDANLKVNPSPFVVVQGEITNGFRGFGPALAPLFADETLHAINLHSYVGFNETGDPMNEMKATYGPGDRFKAALKYSGLGDLPVVATEFNYNCEPNRTEDDSGQGLLTTLWDYLGATRADGRTPATEFVLLFAIHKTPSDGYQAQFGLSESFTPWVPTPRGKVLQMLCTLGEHMELRSCDPDLKGEYVLEGNGRKLWVWQNLVGWTDRPGSSYVIDNISPGATQLQVLRYNSWTNGAADPYKTVALNNQTSVTVSGLPENETLMFYTTMDNPNLAAGKTISASAEGGIYTANKANDGNDSTYWQSPAGSYPVNLEINLNQLELIQRLSLQVNAVWGNRTQEIAIQASTDQGASWQTVLSKGEMHFEKADQNVVDIDLPDTLANRLRLVFYSNTGADGGQISEWKIYGTNASPTVALTSPSPSGRVIAGTNVRLCASANDADGSIDRVEFYAGKTLLGTDTTAPYELNWKASGGVYHIFAKAVDNDESAQLSPTSELIASVYQDLAPSAALTASHNSSQVAKVVNGDASSYWYGGANSGWIQADLGGNRNINVIELQLKPDWGSRTQQVTIKVSGNESTWTTIVPQRDYEFCPYKDNLVRLNVGNHNQRYVRIELGNNSGSATPQLSALRLYCNNGDNHMQAFDSSLNIGNPAIPGNGYYNAGTYELTGSGKDIWNQSDEFTMMSRYLEGDFSLVAKVDSLDNTNSWAKAGLMVRENHAADSPFFNIVVTPGNGISVQYRSTKGASAGIRGSTSGSALTWLRLDRAGDQFNAFVSSNGSTWTQLGSTMTLPFSQTVTGGLCYTSHNNNSDGKAVFSNVAINGIGNAVREWWNGLSGTGIDQLVNATDFPISPVK